MCDPKGGQSPVVQLSIVIPTFNEAGRIGATLEALSAYVSTLPFVSEIVVVDDGSSDQTTEIVRTKSAELPQLVLLELPKNLGKGAAVSSGMLSAKGVWRLFMDADNSTDVKQFEKLKPFLEAGIPVVVGSRTAYGAIVAFPQPLIRRIAGWIFRTAVRVVFTLPVTDTQNGFKAFSSHAAEQVFSRVGTHRWAFDVELLAVAKYLGLVILEVPVEWTDDRRSKMTSVQAMTMAVDLLKVSWRLSSIRCYWLGPPDVTLSRGKLGPGKVSGAGERP